MTKKGQTSGKYEIEVAYYELTIDELFAILKLYHDNELGIDKYLGDPVIERGYDTDCDGWSEPNDTWTIKLNVANCGGIGKESFEKWYKDRAIECYEEADEIRRIIKEKTGIE